jgi:hypothetical protein
VSIETSEAKPCPASNEMKTEASSAIIIQIEKLGVIRVIRRKKKKD